MRLYLYEQKLVLTEGDEGGVGDASFRAGDTCGGVEERRPDPNGAASSESPGQQGKEKNLKSLSTRVHPNLSDVSHSSDYSGLVPSVTHLMLQRIALKCPLLPPDEESEYRVTVLLHLPMFFFPMLRTERKGHLLNYALISQNISTTCLILPKQLGPIGARYPQDLRRCPVIFGTKMSPADPLSPMACEVEPPRIGLVCPAHPAVA